MKYLFFILLTVLVLSCSKEPLDYKLSEIKEPEKAEKLQEAVTPQELMALGAYVRSLQKENPDSIDKLTVRQAKYAMQILQNYREIEKGMSYEQVATIMGESNMNIDDMIEKHPDSKGEVYCVSVPGHKKLRVLFSFTEESENFKGFLISKSRFGI